MRNVNLSRLVLLRNVRSLLSLFCLVLAGGCFTASASAQVTFGGTVTTLATLNQGTGFASFKSIAADSVGNIYATEMAYNFSPSFFYASSVLKFTPQGDGSYLQSTLVAGPSGSEYMGIAVDTAGNVYYADFGNSAIVELTASGGSYTAATLPISITNPLSVAVDASGNLFLGNNSGTVYEEVLSQGAYTQQTIWTANPGSTPLTIALDSNDDLYITQGGNLNVVVLTNQGSYSYTQNGFTIPSGNQPSNVGDAVPDSAGDVYVDDSGNGILYEYLYANGSYTETVVSSSLTTPDALLLGANGNLFIGSASLVELQIGSVPFGTQAVAANPGTSTDTIALPFNVAAGQTVGSVKILTTGIAGKDFVDAGSSTCTAQTYANATSCVVNVNFTPLAPGLRQGAVVIADGSGNTLSSVLLYGTGTGPLPVYASAASATLQGGYVYVQGAAVDSAGNVYVVDESGGPNYSGTVYKIAPGGAQTLVTSSISNPSGIAIDGAGNLYISSAYPGGVYEIAPSGTVSQIPALSSYLYLQQIALDGQGNLYVAAGYPSSVLKYSPSGQVTQLGTGTQYPEGIAVDTAGNVYVGDCGSSSVYRITPSGATIGLVSGIYNCPASLAIDPAGNLYIGQQYGGPVLEYTTAGVLNTVIQGNFSLGGMALDSAGNLFYSDDNTGNLFESKQATAPLLAFAATDKGSSSASGPQVETLTNAGNAPLTFSNIAFPTDFPEDSADSTDCSVSAPLASAASCTFTIDFKPVEPSPASLSETVTATTNYLPKPAQTIPVSGVELYMTTVATPTFSLPAGTYPAEQGVTIKDATPNTTIFYTVDGSTPTTASALYRGPVPVYTSETLQAIAVKGGMNNSSVASAQYIVQAGPPTATPVLVPGSFSGNNPTTVTITDSMPGSTFYYTVNGTTPTIESPVYTGPLTIGNSVTLKAIAVAPGYSPSSVVSGTYTLTAANPIISLASGTYTGPQTVTITTASTGASIFYTTNGSTPNVNATKYTGPITVSASETLTAIAQATGYAASSPVSATYYISAPPSAPAFSPAGGTYNNAQSITLSDTGSNATFYYTLDGSMPTTASHKYTGPISMQNGETINAVAFVPGYGLSSVGSATYALAVATPVVSVPAGTYSGPQTVSVTTATTGAAIFYSTNGTPATASSARYTGPITVNSSETLNVIALATGYTPSATVAAKYYIGQAPTTPVLSLNSGVYNNNQTVSISESAPGATIYYTLNGSTPTTTSPKYTSPITINNSVTLNAIAVEPGYNPTAVASATYTLTAANPVISLASGSYTGAQTVTVTTASTNAILVYTTNGNQPVPGSTKYTGPITVNASETLRVMAIATGYNNSAIVTNTYTIH